MQTSTCTRTGDIALPKRATLPETLYRKLKAFIDGLPQKEGHLVSVLHKAQSIFGYLPKEVQEFVAQEMDESLAKVYGVVSFYTFFTMVPKGKFPISICLGTACFVKGAENVLDSFKQELGIGVGEVTMDGKFSIDCVRCIGACALAPVLTVGTKVYPHVTPDQVKSILAEY
ncbi:MAG: NAD(P)H-dependent oxidoreductase subunit E [Verrucomicrobiota bacterium]|jgi:NADP-reducing hydrogenase subunit HndA|nr:NAD(P)H-dependent oxidoreductase subunit E [Verrucomicrobiota bacterium]MDD8046330.1 NAD(P)H-dependent oxidoreductase subunit E [Verrucomicrobiota bacterium]MDD8051377.1 NAD(P)H-dependent oxidoreductase subunit E [Verrucomicrobiota bacterium]MDI9384247.1 NAD(P)H-dependent oxidoreductase subunit E [Verrucomicrobiota bacterium]HCF96909.1 NAD(P)H-dependent oxidoreductase subunit E [Verrucomicrobiota bacterium]